MREGDDIRLNSCDAPTVTEGIEDSGTIDDRIDELDSETIFSA